MLDKIGTSESNVGRAFEKIPSWVQGSGFGMRVAGKVSRTSTRSKNWHPKVNQTKPQKQPPPSKKRGWRGRGNGGNGDGAAPDGDVVRGSPGDGHGTVRRADALVGGVQHMVSTWPAHGQHMASTWSEHGQHMASTWPAHGQHMASTWSAHGQHMASTWPAHGQQMAKHGQHMVSTWSAHLVGGVQQRLAVRKRVLKRRPVVMIVPCTHAHMTFSKTSALACNRTKTSALACNRTKTSALACYRTEHGVEILYAGF